MSEVFRVIGPPVLAVASALLIDRGCARRRLLPPLFRRQHGDAVGPAEGRRYAALAVIALVLWIGVFAPLGALGSAADFDPAAVTTPQLFLLHGLLLLSVAAWYLLGFGLDGGRWRQQLGLASRHPLTEVAIGIGAGAAAWLMVILVMLGTGVVLWTLGGRELLPDTPPPIVPWLAGLPLVVRLAVSASAGIGEELFFRGFLQPRIGIALSTALFVLAHVSYEQPFMLLGVTLLSLVFAGLVRWRQNIWAAIVAHATFDAIQLAVVIPWALRHVGSGELPVVAILQ